jgi:uncharacterized protein YjiS (DUF1127 family)
MTNQINATAGLPLFETHGAHAVDVQAIINEAHVMRARVLTGMVKNAVAAIKSALRAQRTSRKLNQLSDAVLADIGIERAQIPSISRALANGTHPSQTVSATVTVLDRTDADTEIRDDRQPELPLAA